VRMAIDGCAATGEVRAMAITVASASFFITFSRPTEARVLLRRPVLDDEWLTETLRQPLTDQRQQNADAPHPRLLRARRERPRGRRAAECSQQFPPSDGDCHVPLPCEGA